MSQENQSSLRFSLEESLWFRKGQEVEELISISLDPDITIQENDQYVTIRGSLELIGEYKSFDESDSGEEEISTFQKYVQTIEEREEGTYHFSHRFPVDITIPNNRIQSIYDIDVMVESFDYTLPERSCLSLSAELTISGLYSSQQDDSNQEAEEEEIVEEVIQRTTQEMEDEEEADEEVVLEEDVEEQTPLFVVEARKLPEEKVEPEQVSYPNFSYQAVQEEAVHAAERKAVPPEFGTYPHHDHNDEIVYEEESVEFVEESSIVTAESSSSSSHTESPPKTDLKKKIVEKILKKKTMSLTEFFARKEEEGEDQAKLKVCIVQKGDTLDQLAERYQVSIQNLLRMNNLEMTQDVSEGQVLYIPITLARK